MLNEHHARACRSSSRRDSLTAKQQANAIAIAKVNTKHFGLNDINNVHEGSISRPWMVPLHFNGTLLTMEIDLVAVVSVILVSVYREHYLTWPQMTACKTKLSTTSAHFLSKECLT